jgi:hypothetical protein
MKCYVLRRCPDSLGPLITVLSQVRILPGPPPCFAARQRNVGITPDLKQRLEDHDRGKSPLPLIGAKRRPTRGGAHAAERHPLHAQSSADVDRLSRFNRQAAIARGPFFPEIGFSHRHRLYYNAIGVLSYWRGQSVY